MYGPGQTNNYQQQRQTLIRDNYWSVYESLLPDDRRYDKGKYMIPCNKKPFYIGKKDVYALSDIEGQNLEFLKMLSDLGLVECTTDHPNELVTEKPDLTNLDTWRRCQSLQKGITETINVYYKFDVEKCKKFDDVIVLCGDYLKDCSDISKGTVQILEALNHLLNNDGKAEGKDKRLFLVAGNHDIYSNYNGENNNDVIKLKHEVLKLGLYPQLLLQNRDGKRLLFQHTNFPYLENGNFIVNKTLDIGKTKNFIQNSFDMFFLDPTSAIFDLGGFFSLRFETNETGKGVRYRKMGTEHNGQGCDLLYEKYSDHGIGYDAKFIGHDPEFLGAVKENNGSMIYNVHVMGKNKYNKGERNYFRYYCASKHFGEFYKIFIECYKQVNNNPSLFNTAFDTAFKSYAAKLK